MARFDTITAVGTIRFRGCEIRTPAGGAVLTVLVTPMAVVEEARRWLEVPFRHQGRSREGIDCAGLVIRVAHALGLSEFDVRDYRARPDGLALKAYCDREMVGIPVSGFGAGDVLLFRNADNDPQHMGIVGDHPAGGFSLIHAYEPNGEVVEQMLDRRWRHFLVAAYRLPGVA